MGERSKWRPARLREAHAHIHPHGRSKSMVDLSDCRSAAEILNRLAEAYAGLPPAPSFGSEEERRRWFKSEPWVLAHGARIESFEDPEWPPLEELDAIVPDRGLAAWSFDHHELVTNSLSLSHAHLASDTLRDPCIVRDADGKPTGLLQEHAAHQLWSSRPESSHERATADTRLAIEDLARHGFVEVHDLKSDVADLHALATCGEEGWLRETGVSVKAFYAHADWGSLDELEDNAWQIKLSKDLGAPGVRVVGGKIFVDGTLNGRTAWMLHPYADGRPEHPEGMRLLSQEEIANAIEACVASGLQLAAHAIGDAAVRAVLDAAERARAPRGSVRIEHAALIDEADVPRFAELGVIASVQPCHLLYDIEALRRACPDRLDRALPIRELIDSGLKPGRDILFGSDTPIVRPDPEDSILAATNRGRSDMALADGIAPSQAISEAEAWACFDADA
ncbi:MAG: amidohydrolase [Phycisphaerales bacterium]